MHPMLNEKKGGWPNAFVVYDPVERNFHIPCMSRTQNTHKKIGCISSSIDCFSITKKFRESFPAHQTLHDKILINDNRNAQFYCKLKYTCMQIWLNKIWYSHCPDLFVYTSSSLAFFLVQWVKSAVTFPSRPFFKFSCGQELFQQFLHDLSAKGIAYLL